MQISDLDLPAAKRRIGLGYSYDRFLRGDLSGWSGHGTQMAGEALGYWEGHKQTKHPDGR